MFAPNPRRYLFVFAHPDDESLGAGATIARLTRQGDQVTVLTCTRGERGDIVPAHLAHLAADPEGLAAHRDLELRDALMALGVTRRAYLGSAEARASGRAIRMYRDSGMVWSPGRIPVLPEPLDPESLCAADPDEVADDIAAVIEQVAPDVIVTENARGGYGHPDHVLVHEAVLAAAGRRPAGDRPFGVFVIERPARVAASAAKSVAAHGRFSPIDGDRRDAAAAADIDVVVEAPESLDAKTAALRAHRTQLLVVDGEVGHSDGRGEPISATEYFREVGGLIVRPSSRPLGDFLDGWDPVETRSDGTRANARTGEVLVRPRRLARDVLLLVVSASGGIVLGAVAAVAHRATLSSGELALPIGFVVSLLAILLCHTAVRLLSASRVPLVGLAIGTLAAIAGLASLGPGDSVIFPAQDVVVQDGVVTGVANVASVVWLAAASIVVAVVVVWPRVGARTVLPERGIMEAVPNPGGKP